MSKKKSIARESQTEVEKAERLLAEMVANARSRGLKYTKETYFKSAAGERWVEEEQAAACCALGAASLSFSTEAPNKRLDKAQEAAAVFGYYIVWGSDGTVAARLYKPCSNGQELEQDLAYDIGAAYRDIMVEEAGTL